MSDEIILGSEFNLSSMADVSDMDFEKVFKKAVQIFSDQAMLDKDPRNISIRDLEISKAKANNFLDAIAGLVELQHQVEVISASKHGFKRADELTVLNVMRKTCEISAQSVEKMLRKAMKHMEYIEGLDESEIKVEDMVNLQNLINENVGISQKLISSFSRLLQLERMSGNRPYGTVRSSSISTGHIKEFSKTDSNKSEKEARPLSKDELEEMLAEMEDDF